MSVGTGVFKEDKTITYSSVTDDVQYTAEVDLSQRFAFTNAFHYTYTTSELTSVVIAVEVSLDGKNWTVVDSQTGAGDGNYIVRGTGPLYRVRTKLTVTGTGDLVYEYRVGRMS